MFGSFGQITDLEITTELERRGLYSAPAVTPPYIPITPIVEPGPPPYTPVIPAYVEPEPEYIPYSPTVTPAEPSEPVIVYPRGPEEEIPPFMPIYPLPVVERLPAVTEPPAKFQLTGTHVALGAILLGAIVFFGGKAGKAKPRPRLATGRRYLS